MRLRKILALLCAGTMLALSVSGCDDKSSNSTEDSGSEQSGIVMNEDSVKLVGRTYLKDDVLWLSMSGTGAEFNYTGKNLQITVKGDGSAAIADNTDNYARIAIYANGERVIDDMVDEAEKTYDVFTSDTEETVSVQIVKLSECAMSNVGIEPIVIADGEKIEPAAEKTHKIEFIGDSITCGYGVDDEDENHHFSTTTEDCTKAYAYKTAQKLDADYSLFSISGYGIISGYTSTGEATDQKIPDYYEKVGFSYNKFDDESPQSIDWDFDKFQPEAVVINLGTNDDSYCQSDDEKKEEFVAAYVEFIKKIREKNPDAKIFCTVGTMGTRIYTSVEDAYVRYIQETGDENVAVYCFDQQNSTEDGLAADWHPTEKTHEKSAEALAEFIKSEMGW